jgi:hypothetical protein
MEREGGGHCCSRVRGGIRGVVIPWRPCLHSWRPAQRCTEGAGTGRAALRERRCRWPAAQRRPCAAGPCWRACGGGGGRGRVGKTTAGTAGGGGFGISRRSRPLLDQAEGGAANAACDPPPDASPPPLPSQAPNPGKKAAASLPAPATRKAEQQTCFPAPHERAASSLT